MTDHIAIRIHNTLQYGLGDIFRTWLQSDSWCSALKDLSRYKEIHLLVCSHNDNAINFFDYVPYLTAHNIIWKGVTPDYENITKKMGIPLMSLKDQGALTQNYKLEPTEIYLGPEEEEEQFKEITSTEYIIIHPFAGDKQRMPIEPDKYNSLINKISVQKDIKIVVIGGSFKRNLRQKTISGHYVKEDFNCTKRNVVNLVNKTSIRLAAKLVANAKCFMGNWSAYLCVAWERKIPAIVFFGLQGRNLPHNKTFSRRWHDKCYAIDAFKVKPEEAFTKAVQLYGKYIG